MKPLIGEIGKFVLDGKQVGGFRNWTTFVQTESPIKSWVIASGWWMLERVNTNHFEAVFYTIDEDEPFEIYRKEAIIKLPEDYSLDKLVIQPIEITFPQDFDWRYG